MGRLQQHGLPSGAMSIPGIRAGEPQAAEVKRVHLTAEPLGWPLWCSLNVVYLITFNFILRMLLEYFDIFKKDRLNLVYEMALPYLPE